MKAGLLINLTLLPLLLSLNLQANEQCIPKGEWFLPDSGKSISTEKYLPQIYKEELILLGEHHENASHHQWQLALLKKLYDNNPNIIIGLEMFPRRMQPLLNKWINKTVDQETFLKESEWDDIWAFDFNYYLPMLTFARDNQIPLVAINIDKSLLKMAGEHGWENIPTQHRNGIGDPAKPAAPYVRQLAISFQGHYADPSKVSKQAFLRFVQQQLLWDRAMAEALASTKQENPSKQVVGVVGSWHIIDGHGIPYQLKSLGVKNMLTLVPWDEHLDCGSVNQQFADAIFGTLPDDGASFSANQ